jgi:hypothetical protein
VLDYFALVVLVVVAAAGIWLVVLIGNTPGNIARAAEHPQADAIAMLAWIGILTLGVSWFIALVWAKYKPDPHQQELVERIERLEQQLSVEGSPQ